MPTAPTDANGSRRRTAHIAPDDDTQLPNAAAVHSAAASSALLAQPSPSPSPSPSASYPSASATSSRHYNYRVHSSSAHHTAQPPYDATPAPTPTPPLLHQLLASPAAALKASAAYHWFGSPLTRTPPPHAYSPTPPPPPSQPAQPVLAALGGRAFRIHLPTPSPPAAQTPPVLTRTMAATAPQWHLRDSPLHWQAAEASVTRVPRVPRIGGNGSLRPTSPSAGPYRPSMTHVEFHHTLDMDDTFVDSRDDSTVQTASRRSTLGERHSGSPSPSTTISAYPSSLPSTLMWPLHPHPLVYAGTSSGNSVHICKCRNCGSEHYNTAVYSCTERGCNFHICIQCALEQITALREQERQQQLTRRAAKTSHHGTVAEGKYEEDDDAVDVDMTYRVPIKAAAGAAANRVSRTNRRWMTSVAASASSIGIPLLYTSAHHPHPLLYTPVTPFHLSGHIEDKLHTHTPLLSSISADRWNCSSCASHSCIAYQSPSLSSSIPTYSCSHCAYRICFPCLRHQHIKQTTTSAAPHQSGLQSPYVSQQRQEALTHLRNNRAIESSISTYCQVVHSEDSLHHRQRLGNYIIGFSSFLAVLLLHAMLLSWTTLNSYIENEWTNVIIMLIFSSLAAITMKAINRLILSHQQHLTQAMLRLCNYYQELDFQQLLIPQGKHTPPSNSQITTSPPLDTAAPLILLNYRIRLSHLTPRQKHIISAVYYLHSEIFRYQNNTPLFALLALLFMLAAEALLAAAVVLLFVVVLCRLPVNVLIGSCETRLGVPIGIGMLGCLTLVHLGELARVGWAFVAKRLHRL